LFAGCSLSRDGGFFCSLDDNFLHGGLGINLLEVF
jgi:hypothetical protein